MVHFYNDVDIFLIIANEQKGSSIKYVLNNQTKVFQKTATQNLPHTSNAGPTGKWAF